MTDRKPTSMTTSSPLSVRLSPEERAVLVRAAGGRPLSTYVCERLFESDADGLVLDEIPADRRKKLLAKGLFEMGSSGIGKSLSTLAEAAERGELIVDDEIRARLLAALRDIRDMRLALMKGLGLRRKARS